MEELDFIILICIYIYKNIIYLHTEFSMTIVDNLNVELLEWQKF